MDRRRESVPNPATRRGPPTSQPASYQRRQSQNSNRLSVQSENPSQATSSPFQSPQSPEFPPEAGLAPRPSSFPYGGPGSEAPVRRAESSRQRDARNKRLVSLDKPLPPSPPPTDRREAPSNYRTGSGFDSQQIDPSSATSGRVKSFSDRSRPQSQSAQDPHRLSSRGHRREVSGGQGQVHTARGGTRAGIDDPATEDPSADPSSPQQRREWAPDRSPLQKLELTLQDISNEEHRAQTEEAELLARDARAGRGSQSRRTGRSVPNAASDPSRPVNKEGDPLAEAGLVRNLSVRHKDRLQRSATVESRKPDEASRGSDPSAEGGFEYQEREYNKLPEPTRTAGRNGATKANGVTGLNPDSRNQEQQHRLSEIYDTDVINRPNQARSASYRRSKPPGEQNPSFVAPAQDYRARKPGSQNLKYAAPPQTASAYQARQQVGFGTEAAVATAAAGAGAGAAATMTVEKRHLSDYMHLHRRPKNVGQNRGSFPDPGNQEWRSGRVAKLTRTDLIIDKPSATENKAWWEERQSSRRRAANGTDYSKTAGISGLDGRNSVDQGRSAFWFFIAISILSKTSTL